MELDHDALNCLDKSMKGKGHPLLITSKPLNYEIKLLNLHYRGSYPEARV